MRALMHSAIVKAAMSPKGAMMSEKKEPIPRLVRAAAGPAGLVAVILAGIAAGFGLRAAFFEAPPPEGTTAAPADGADDQAKVWTCSMHPEVRRSGPGLCPKCQMKLIPVRSAKTEGLREFTTSEAAIALMDIETATVERKFVEAEIRMVGKVDYDETRLAYITAWVPGRLDRLYVDYTGVPVRKGDHLVYIYSPELLTAQEELLQGLESVKALKNSDVSIVRTTSEATVVAAREKLRLLGLTAEQIANVERTGEVSDHLTIYSPSSGIVVHKNAREGMYVNTGTRIYTIADLSQVWVKLDAYESDLMWLRYGQRVQFTTISQPGEVFEGIISFIDPVLDSGTRTVKVRVNVRNSDGRLKPGMFVKAVARARVAAGGKVMDADLAGKWISPMHPEIVKDSPGKCDICGMPLVQAESLGYVGVDPAKTDKPLAIPASAVLKTGTRAIVYVAEPGAVKPTYEGREILLGPRAGDYYLVRAGLREQERVVVRGNFKIDSALQILAKPSMMSPEGGDAGGEHAHHGAPAPLKGGAGKSKPKVELPPLSSHQVRQVLDAADEVDAVVRKGQTTPVVKRAFAELGRRLSAVDTELLQGHAAMVWKEYAMRLSNDAAEGETANTPKDIARVAASLRGNAGALRVRLGLAHEEAQAPATASDPQFLAQLEGVYSAYLALQKALASDRADEAVQAGKAMLAALEKVDMKLVAGDDHAAWMRFVGEARTTLKQIAEAEEITEVRSGFALLSEEVLALAKRFGPPAGTTFFDMKCPMAFDNRGARWLQSDSPVRNPYFGAAMLQCGEVVEVIEARPTAQEGGGHDGHGQH